MRLRWSLPALPRAAASRLWRGWARAVVVLGVICAFVAWGLPRVLVIALVTPLVVMGVALFVDARDLGRSVRIALAATAVVVAGTGVVAALGWSGLVLLAPLGVIGWILQTPAPPPPPAEPDEAPESVESFAVTPFWVFEIERMEEHNVKQLTDLELCTEWRRSFSVLSVASQASVRLEVVRVRQVYLDEIERRHPVELKRWLASGARAAGNPMPFLSGSTRDGVAPSAEPAGPASSDGQTWPS